MHKLLQFSAFFLLFTFSIFATPIHYAPIIMGDITTFVPYSNVKISLRNNRTFNQGENNILTANINHPNDIVRYEWREGNNLLGVNSTFSTKDLSSGIHNIRLIVFDNNGLSTSNNITINIVSNIYNGLLTSIEEINKENLPIYLKALDMLEINKYVAPYMNYAYPTDINRTIKFYSENGGEHTLDISMPTTEVMHIIHKFDNYSDNYTVINGVIHNRIYFSSTNIIQDVSVNNLNIVSSTSNVTLEGFLHKSDKNGLLIQNFIVKDLNKTIYYENFTDRKQSSFLTLYSGKICNSIFGCTNISTTYDETKIHSENIVLKGQSNSATVNKDYNGNLLSKINKYNKMNKYLYLVYDKNITNNDIPIYEANISLEEYIFSNHQKNLNKNDIMPIKIVDLNEDGKNELIFLTRSENSFYNSDVKLYINNELNTYIYDIFDKGYDKSFYFFDNNNDGLKDIFIPKYLESELYIQNNDNTFVSQKNWEEESTGTGSTNYRTFLPDFNGDGKDDRVSLYGCNLKILTNILNDNNMTLIPLQACSNFTGHEYFHEGISLRLGDFNNDSVDDFLIVYKDNRNPIYNGNNSYFIVLNNGNGAVSELNSVEIDDNTSSRSDPFAIGNEIVVGDINQDGYDDFIINGHLFINNKNDTFTKRADLFTNDSFGGEQYIKIQDINSDGIKDVIFSGYLGIRSVLIFNDYKYRDILLFDDGDKRDIRNISIDNLDNSSVFDIVRNHNNKIEFIHFK